MALVYQRLNINFLETGYKGQTDFTVFQYSATNNGLSYKSRCCVQRSAVKVNCTPEITCSVFVPILLVNVRKPRLLNTFLIVNWLNMQSKEIGVVV
jgi:hypothetical protein